MIYTTECNDKYFLPWQSFKKTIKIAFFHTKEGSNCHYPVDILFLMIYRLVYALMKIIWIKLIKYDFTTIKAADAISIWLKLLVDSFHVKALFFSYKQHVTCFMLTYTSNRYSCFNDYIIDNFYYVFDLILEPCGFTKYLEPRFFSR